MVSRGAVTLRMVAPLVLLGVGLVAGIVLVSWRPHGSTPIPQADAAAREAIQHQTRAEMSEARATDRQPELDASRAEVARLRAQLHRVQDTGPGPSSPDAGPADAPDVVDPAADPREELIQAQAHHIELLEAQVVDLQARGDGYKAALAAREREIACLRIAQEAHVAALRAERWKGRFEGLAVGVGVGFVGGRIVR